MSAFSRGVCTLRCQFLYSLRSSHFFHQSSSLPQARSLTSSGILRAATKPSPKSRVIPKGKQPFFPTNTAAPKSPATKSPSTTGAIPPSPAPNYLSYEAKLAVKPHPTLLYQAPSHGGFIIGSYIGATFCFAWATFNFWSYYLHPPDGLAWWVPSAYGGVCFLMAAAGGYFLLGPAWVVRSITAMPFSSLKAAGAATNGIMASDMRIEIELRKMVPLPFMPARKLYVQPKQIRLAHQLARSETKLSAAEMRAMRALEEEERLKALQYERSHILSKGPRAMSRGLFDVIHGIKRTWTRDGFTKIWIKEYRYKLDVSGGWALDSGRALDRLVTIKPSV